MVLELRTDRTEMCIGCDGGARDRARVCLHSERSVPRGPDEARWYRGASSALDA